jgi:hypothetical protein
LEHIDKTIAQALEKLKAQEEAVAQTKRLVNQLLEFASRSPMFTDIIVSSGGATLLGDEYYGQKQSTACRMVLERRKAMNLGPATVDEIFSMLKEGGYKHEAKSEEIAMKSIYNMLVQNSAIFHRLPTGKFGLAAWYPDAPKKKRERPGLVDFDDPAAVDAAADDALKLAKDEIAKERAGKRGGGDAS